MKEENDLTTACAIGIILLIIIIGINALSKMDHQTDAAGGREDGEYIWNRQNPSFP